MLTRDRIGFSLYLWALLEWNLGIICACLPSLRVLFHTALKSSSGESKQNKHNSEIQHNAVGWCGKPGDDSRDGPLSQAIELERTFTISSSTAYPLDNKKPFTRYSSPAKTNTFTRCNAAPAVGTPGTQRITPESTLWLRESDERTLLARSEHISSRGSSPVRSASPV